MIDFSFTIYYSCLYAHIRDELEGAATDRKCFAVLARAKCLLAGAIVACNATSSVSCEVPSIVTWKLL